MDPRLVDLARKGWRPITFFAVLGALIALLVGELLVGGTTASTVVAVSDDSVRAVRGDGLDVDELRQVVVAVAETEDTVALVVDEAGLESGGDITITAETEVRSPVVTLHVKASSDERALAAADVLGTVLGRERQRILSEALDTSIGRAQAQLTENLDQVAQVEADLAAIDQQRASAADPVAIERFDREAAVLEQELLALTGSTGQVQADLARWEETIVAAGGSVTQVEEATLTDDGPAPLGVALVGFAAGAIGAFGYQVVMDERRRARRERYAAGMASEDISRWYFEAADEPQSLTLAQQGATLPLPRADQLMSYRGVLASVLLPSTSVIAVAGIDDYEGSGASAIALAHAYAGAGRNVVLISTQVPPLSSSADELQQGLHALLTEGEPLDDVLIPLDARHGDLRYLPPGALRDVDQLTAHIDDLAGLLHDLTSSGADLVILELPPLLSANAAISLCRLSHGVVLSTVAGRTHDEDRERAVRRLRTARSVVLGEITHEDHLPRPIFVRPAEEAEGELIDLRIHVRGA